MSSVLDESQIINDASKRIHLNLLLPQSNPLSSRGLDPLLTELLLKARMARQRRARFATLEERALVNGSPRCVHPLSPPRRAARSAIAIDLAERSQ
jgi:hypothetical protein